MVITENKSAKFHRIAAKRVDSVLNSLRLLRQCSNRRIYEYDDSEIKKMFRQVDLEVRQTKETFQSVQRKFQF